jgi:tetratricopeptide (TPR) repeat protein
MTPVSRVWYAASDGRSDKGGATMSISARDPPKQSPGAAARMSRVTTISGQRALLILLLATELLYLPSLHADFVNFDDPEYVTANPDVRRPVLSTIFNIGHLKGWDWTPTVTLSHVLEYRLFGLRPVGYHLTNMLLHGISIVLVYLLWVQCGVGPVECLATALVFACHPLQVESVAWIAARKNLLAAVFGLAFVRAFLAAKPLLGTTLLLLALGSKGTAVVFPCWAAVAVFLGFGKWSRRQALPWLILFLALAVPRAMITAVAQAPVIMSNRVARMSLLQRMAVMGPVFATQVRQFFLPYGLCLVYSPGSPSWVSARVLLSWEAVALLLILLVWWARRERHVMLAACWVGLAMLPTAQIVPAPLSQADRYAHLALVGAALLGVKLLRPLERVRWWLPGMVLGLWCGTVFVPLTHARLAVWQDSATLGEDTANHETQSGVGWNILGNYHVERGETDLAEAAWRRALEPNPDYSQPHYNLALLLLTQGRLAEAEVEAETFLRVDKARAADGDCLLGSILLAQQRSRDSLPYFDRALQRSPEMSAARYGRAVAHLRLGQLDAAADDLQALIEPGNEDPNLMAMLAAVRLRQGHAPEALDLARQATARDPRSGVAWDAVGQALLASGDVDGAEAALRTGIAATPNLADLHYHLAQLHESRGEHEAARTAAAEAIALLQSTPPDWDSDARRLAQ